MTFARLASVSLLFVSVASGCSTAHGVEPGGDAGSLGDAAPDAAAHACHLASPAPEPVFAGEGCYCDGPFVVRGDVAYRQSFMLEVIDVSVPGAPQLVTSVSSSAVFAADLAIVGDVLFTAGGSVERFDLTDPRAPVSLGTIELGGHVEAMALGAQRLVASITREDGTRALVAVDVRDPRGPVIGGSVELGARSVSTIAMHGTIALAAAMDASGSGASAQILALDASAAAAPRVVGTLETALSYLASVAVHDDRLFVGGIETGVRAIDVGDPSAMRELGLVVASVPGQQAVSVSGDVLVVSGQGLSLFDLGSPELALLGQTAPTFDSPHAALAGAQLLGSGGNALFSVPLDCE